MTQKKNATKENGKPTCKKAEELLFSTADRSTKASGKRAKAMAKEFLTSLTGISMREAIFKIKRKERASILMQKEVIIVGNIKKIKEKAKAPLFG